MWIQIFNTRYNFSLVRAYWLRRGKRIDLVLDYDKSRIEINFEDESKAVEVLALLDKLFEI